MSRVPHVYLPGPWEAEGVVAPRTTIDHLNRVLRTERGSTVSYTDGTGVIGQGRWDGDGITRGEESVVERPRRSLTVAVAPPKMRDRQRFIAEKLQELGAGELIWLTTDRSELGPPRDDRSRAWTVSALEQSRSSWLMTVRVGALDDIDGAVVLDPAATDKLRWPGDGGSMTIAIGPEGGFTDDEVDGFVRASLGESILRTETAVVAAASVLLLA